MGLIGCILYDNRVYERVADVVKAEHFGVEPHGRIFEAVGKLIARGTKADPAVLRDYFAQDDSLSQVGGAAYLGKLASAVVTTINARDYANTIRDCWVRRRIIDIASTAMDDAYEADIDMDAAGKVDALQSELSALGDIGSENYRAIPLGEATNEALDKAAEAEARGTRINGIRCGYHALDRLLGGFQPGVYVLGGRTSMGKEQPIDTPVLTVAGWKPIGALKAGDVLSGPDGGTRKVVSVHPQGVKPAYRVTFSDRSSTECGMDHLWAVSPCGGRSRKKVFVRSVNDLLSGGLRHNNKGNRIKPKWRIPTAFVGGTHNHALPIDPYLLGVLIGDGSIGNSDVRFSTPDMDRDIVDRVASLLPPDLHLHENRSGACPYFAITGTGRKGLRKTIAALGLNVLSPKKFIPAIYATASAEERLRLLRGLMDTDGSCLGKGSSFYTSSNLLATNVVDLVRSLGGVARLRSYDRSHHDKPIEYIVSIKMPVCPFYTERKRKAWKPYPASRYIVSIEHSRDCEQICISVDAPDGLYITNDYIVTHNTSLARGLALNVATAAAKGEPNSGPVIYFSMEMTAAQMGAAIVGPMAGITTSDLMIGAIGDNWQKLMDAQETLAALPLVFDDRAGLTTSEIHLAAKRMKRKQGLGLIVVDLLGYVSPPPGNEHAPDTMKLHKIMIALKASAKALGVPILLIHQLSRKTEDRDDPRPRMADLANSGSIEQDADVVMFVFREAYYLSRAEPRQKEKETDEAFIGRMADWREDCRRLEHIGEVIVDKNRITGPIGTVKLFWDGQFARFANLNNEDAQERML